MKKFRYVFLPLFFFAVLSCNQVEVSRSEPLVVCTTNIIADALTILLEDDAEIVSLMGAGVDPHLYKASQKDLEYLQEADIIVSNGLHLEGKMADVLEKLAHRKTVITMSEGASSEELIMVSDNVYDPHIWFDVKMWNSAIAHLADELIANLPELNESIMERSGSYQRKLMELDESVQDRINEIPENQRVLITAHDAFGYFGRAYGIEVMGLQGISTQSEYGLQDISNLVQFIIDHNVKAVFVETSVNDKPLMSVQEGTRKKGHEVSIGGSLYSDALGGMDESGDNYINMVNHNVNTIVQALR